MASASPPRKPSRPDNSPVLLGYIAVLAVAAGAITAMLQRTGARAPDASVAWWALPIIGAHLVAAEYLFVRFRYRGEVNALNLLEAVTVVMLFGFPPVAAVATMAVAQIIGGALRRNPPVKAFFNIAQWSLATAIGGWIVSSMAPEAGVSWPTARALLLMLVVTAVVNQSAFTGVIAIRSRTSPAQVLRDLRSVVMMGWVAGWAVNTLLGLLLVLAYASHPAAVLLFPVPLTVLHLAYRGYAGARSDRVRLAGLHKAAQILSDPLDPSNAITPFLAEVARCFEARAAEMVVRTDGSRRVYRFDAASGAMHASIEPERVGSLERELLALDGPARLTSSGPFAAVLAKAGWRDCLCAPFPSEGIEGVLAVFDQAGLEGFEEGEIAVIEALARETSATFAKGKLLEAILNERQKLVQIVSTTSDGIMTISADGQVRSWNPALEHITGLRAAQVVDRPDPLAALHLRNKNEEPVLLERWALEEELPSEIRITATDGSIRRLACSYAQTEEPNLLARTLVVVARDVTPADEIAELRQRFGRLERAEAAHRASVDRLQEALMPAKPDVEGLDLGVSYLASDPTAPTGGDLYDWQVLPSGELHVVVLDVLGHGVAATKNALGVVHALRVLALDGCPLQRIVARADELLGAWNADLVATVIVGRYSPDTGHLRLATGGHPPPLHVRPNGEVELLSAAGGAIGWPGAGSKEVCELVLEPGDSLVFYTDGVVEARRDIIEGTETLISRAKELSYLPAGEFADAVLRHSLAGGTRRDDSLALVLRRSASRSVGWTIAPSMAEVRIVRKRVAAWLRECGLPEQDVNDMQLIAAELLTNAANAARTTASIDLQFTDGVVELNVRDDGRGLDEVEDLGMAHPSPEADAGRGLFIVRSLTDHFSAVSSREGTSITARRALRAPELATGEMPVVGVTRSDDRGDDARSVTPLPV